MFFFFFISLLPSFLSVSTSPPLSVSVDHVTGSFQVLLQSVPWLCSSTVFLHEDLIRYVSVPVFQGPTSGSDSSLDVDGSSRLSGITRKLRIVEIEKEIGTDRWGRFEETRLVYSSEEKVSEDALVLVGGIKVYEEENVVVFTQTFPNGLKGTSVDDADKVTTGFPTFVTNEKMYGKMGYAHWVSWYYDKQNNHTQIKDSPNSKYSLPAPGFISPRIGIFDNSTVLPDGIDGSGVTCLFSPVDNSALVFSPLENVMPLSLHVPSPGIFEYGVMGNVTSIPAQTSFSFILVSGNGVGDSMKRWGRYVRMFHGKPETAVSKVKDITLNYLGYTTDNGAYYYYNPLEGMTMQDTLLLVKDNAEKTGLPFVYILLDSWWYYRGINNGVTNWTARSDIFPDGLDSFHNHSSWFIQAHNRYWAIDNVYAKKNGGKYEFIADDYGRGMLPNDPNFWDHLFAGASNWGLRVYEQDWLNQQFKDFTESLLTDVTLARTWLKQMNQAALRAGLSVQYCMPLVRHLLQSLEELAVTQARASDDYNHNPVAGYENWRIGGQSILLDALGLSTSKDGFWTTNFQSGNPYGDESVEPYPLLESAITTLSAGPVAIGDKIGVTDLSLVFRSCTKSGRLLHPSHPAKMIDRVIYHKAFGTNNLNGEVWATTSVVTGVQYGYLLAADISISGSVIPSDLSLHEENSSTGYFYAFEGNSTSVLIKFSLNQPLELPVLSLSVGFLFYTIVPVLSNGWSFLGESSKWVAVSPDRFIGISTLDSGLAVRAIGSDQEVMQVDFITPTGEIVPVSCTFGKSGALLITSAGLCNP